MKKRDSFLQFIPVFFLFCLCSCSNGQTAIPRNWQPGMTVRYHEGGGMRYESLDILISDTGCVHTQMKEGVYITKRFNLTEAEQTSLLHFFRAQHFSRIGMYKPDDKVYDKTTIEVIVEWKNHKVSVKDSGGSFIQNRDKKRFRAVIDYLLTLVTNKTGG